MATVVEKKSNLLKDTHPHLLEEWDYEKNEELDIDINKVTYGSLQKVWWRCELGHKWQTSILYRSRGSRCHYCTNQKVLKGYNDIWTTNPELAKQLLNPEDGYLYMQGSNKKLDWKCIDCNSIVRNKSISNVKRQGLSCPTCFASISYPELLMSKLLNELKLDFYQDTTMTWSNNKRYDFYIPSLNMIIETHGMQHYKQTTRKGCRTLEEEQENDRYKEQLAKDSGIENYVVIDCRYSNFELIKNNIESSTLYAILSIDASTWDRIALGMEESIIQEVWDMWDKDEYTITDISKKTGVSRNIIRRYLNTGNELGRITYNKEISKSRADKQFEKSVIQIVDKQIIAQYRSIREASDKTGIRKACIGNVCSYRREKAGGSSWMYLDDYEANGMRKFKGD